MATETLRPNALGDSEQFSPWGETYCWQTVDEVVRDNGTTRARGLNYDLKDLYNIENSSGSGTISSITVYWWIVRYSDVRHRGYHGIKSGATEDWSSEATYTNAYVEYSRQFTTDPDTGIAWTWGAIDAVQVGQKTSSEANEGGSVVDQVYVEVDYTPTLTMTLADTITISDSRVMVIGLIKSDTVTIADSFTRVSEFFKTFGDTVTMSDAVVKAVGLVKSETIAITDTFGKAFTFAKSFSDTITIADSLVRRFMVSLVEKARWRFPTRYTDPTSKISGYGDPKTRWKFPSDYE